MKTIKINFVGFSWDFKPEDYEFFRILKRNYNVVITENADYTFFSLFGNRPFDYCNYPGIRILMSGENYLPDFNFVDYAMCSYPLKLFDRNFCFPFCIDKNGHCESLVTKDRNYPDEILLEKPYFANMIASHDSEHNYRSLMFNLLSEYKRVESPGSFMNNREDLKNISWLDNSKTDFQRKCKFTLCLESTKHEGFITEKITDAFYADTVPVFYGADVSKEIFNEKAFIDLSDYATFEEAVQRIIEIDNDDNLYLSMLRQPIFNDSSFVEKTYSDMEVFLKNIFDQPLEKAKRRSGLYVAKEHEDFIEWASLHYPDYQKKLQNDKKEYLQKKKLNSTKFGRKIYKLKKNGIKYYIKKFISK